MSEQNSVFIFKEETDICLDNNIQSNHIEDNVTNKPNNITPKSLDVNTVNTFEIKTENDCRNIIIQNSVFVKDEVDIKEEILTYVNNYDNNKICHTENVTVTSNIANNITIDPSNVCVEIKLEKDDSDIKEEIPSFHTEVLFHKIEQMSPECGDVSTRNIFKIKNETDYEKTVTQNSNLKEDIYNIKEEIKEEIITYRNDDDNNESNHAENLFHKIEQMFPECGDVSTRNIFKIKNETDYEKTVTQNSNLKEDIYNIKDKIKEEIITYRNDDDNNESNHAENLFHKIEQMFPECGDVSTRNIFKIKNETDYEKTVTQNSNLKEDIYNIKDEIKEEIITYRNDDDNNESNHAENLFHKIEQMFPECGDVSTRNIFKIKNETDYEKTVTQNSNLKEDIYNIKDEIKEEIITYRNDDDNNESNHAENLFHKIEQMSPECGDVSTRNIFKIKTETDYEKTVTQNSNLKEDIYNIKEEIKEEIITHRNDDDNNESNHAEKSNVNSFKSIHGKQIECEKPHNCKICQKSFSRNELLRRHMITHTGIKPFKCSLCKKSFTQKGNIKIHMMTHTGEKPYECNICKKTFQQKGHLKSHGNTHTDIKPFQCELCKKSFSLKYNLNRHMFTHIDVKPHECKICKKSFIQKEQLISHMFIHTGGIKPFKCDLCEKSFSLERSFKKHLISHTDVQLHKCHMCNKSFSRSGVLRRHMITHTDMKPYNCDLCKKSFSQKGSIIIHMVTHTNVKPYECKICKKKFSRNEVLKRHMFTHTDNKPHKCNICKKSFTQILQLKSHMFTHNDIKP